MRLSLPASLAFLGLVLGAACAATGGKSPSAGGGAGPSAGGGPDAGCIVVGSCYGNVSCPVGSVCEENTFTCCQYQGYDQNGPSCLLISPGSLDFGTVGLNPTTKAWCSSPARTVQLLNTCADDIKATAFSIADAGGPAPFVLSGVPALPVDIPVFGAPVTFQVVFQPSSQGLQTGTASVAVDENQGGFLVAAGSYQIELTGNAQPDGQETDTFTVASGQAQVDMLLVIDNDDNAGNTTAPYSSFAKTAVPALFQAANAANVDFQMALTDDDNCKVAGADRGQFEPCAGCANEKNPADGTTTTVFGAGNPKAEAEFAGLVPHPNGYCGTGGSTDEQMLDAFYLALQPEMLAAGGPNAGFLRPDAHLAILEIDDDPEDDHSVLLGSVRAYYDFLLSLKGDPGLVSYSYVNYAGVGVAEANEGSLVKLAGGVESDMSTTHWITDLAAIWSSATAVGRTRFPLDGNPVPSSLAVTVDGVAVPAGTSGWSYDASSDAIEFAAGAAPAAGQTVAVSYTTGCN